MKIALFFQKEEKEAAVICRLCPHHCKIKNSQTGICLSRQNIEGTLYSLGYGKISALNIDPSFDCKISAIFTAPPVYFTTIISHHFGIVYYWLLFSF